MFLQWTCTKSLDHLMPQTQNPMNQSYLHFVKYFCILTSNSYIYWMPKNWVGRKAFLSFLLSSFKYHTRIIITRDFFNFYPLFGSQKHFFYEFFLKILSLCRVIIQERFLITERSEHLLN